MSTRAGNLQPTFTGYVPTTNDALILFEASLMGYLKRVPKRARGEERKSLAKSGSVFIYDETQSGIKRWNDGLPWSPTRSLGNFLLHRQLKGAFPPGEKKKALKKDQRQDKPYSQPEFRGDEERQLMGSLIDSYDFEDGGLMKKRISVTFQGKTYHLISYYRIDDVKGGLLSAPSEVADLAGIKPRPELVSGQNFRAPLEEANETMYVYRKA